MASRAPVMHGYALGNERRRRRVWYQQSDPVVLPAPRSETSPTLIVSALIASSLIAGVAYAVYFSGASPLADTATPPLERSFELDSEALRARTLPLLQRPAFAAPERASAEGESEPDASDTPAPTSRETVIDDSRQVSPPPRRAPAPALAPTPPPQLPDQQPATPYPNPTTTPPDGIAPDLDLNRATPGLDPENPY